MAMTFDPEVACTIILSIANLNYDDQTVASLAALANLNFDDPILSSLTQPTIYEPPYMHLQNNTCTLTEVMFRVSEQVKNLRAICLALEQEVWLVEGNGAQKQEVVSCHLV